jgi:hypothetical protein
MENSIQKDLLNLINDNKEKNKIKNININIENLKKHKKYWIPIINKYTNNSNFIEYIDVVAKDISFLAMDQRALRKEIIIFYLNNYNIYPENFMAKGEEVYNTPFIKQLYSNIYFSDFDYFIENKINFPPLEVGQFDSFKKNLLNKINEDIIKHLYEFNKEEEIDDFLFKKKLNRDIILHSYKFIQNEKINNILKEYDFKNDVHLFYFVLFHTYEEKYIKNIDEYENFKENKYIIDYFINLYLDRSNLKTTFLLPFISYISNYITKEEFSNLIFESIGYLENNVPDFNVSDVYYYREETIEISKKGIEDIINKNNIVRDKLKKINDLSTLKEFLKNINNYYFYFSNKKKSIYVYKYIVEKFLIRTYLEKKKFLKNNNNNNNNNNIFLINLLKLSNINNNLKLNLILN